MSSPSLDNGMSALHQIFTIHIQCSFPIYPVSLFLMILPPPRSTVFPYTTLFRSHVNQITRKWHVGPPPNFLSGIWAPCSVYTVNFICSHSYLRKLHCLG